MLLLALISASVAGYAGVKLAGGKHREIASGKFRSEERNEARTKRWSAGDLRTWAANGRSPLDPFADEWKDWSEGELKAALDQGVTDPAAVNALSDGRRIIGAIFGEWVRRNPDEAIRWLESLKSESMRRSFSGVLAMNWPVDRAAEGLAYVIAHRDDFASRDTISSGPIVTLAINEAAKLGPDAVGRLFGVLRENRLDPRYSKDWEFPVGFDFLKLMEHPETGLLKATFFSGVWMDRNPDEAFRYLVAEREIEDVPVGNFFTDVLPANDAERLEKASARARWLSGKLAELTADKQSAIVDGMSGRYMDPAVLGNFAGGLADDAQRDRIVSKSLQVLMKQSWMDSVAPIVELIEAAGDESWRLDTLESLKTPGRSGAWFVTKEDEQLLREKLTGWNAPPERVETIMNHLKAQ